MQKIIKNKINDLKKLCISLDIKRFYVFGSVVTDNFRDDSDIDFLISFSDKLSIKDYTNYENYLNVKLI